MKSARHGKSLFPVEDAPLTLEQRLALFDPARHGGEVMATDEALGAEK